MVTDADVDDMVLRAERLAVVDFWAPWCSSCLAIAPVVQEIRETYAGRVLFAKMNVDGNPRTKAAVAIQSIPTVVVFAQGREVSRVIGSDCVSASISRPPRAWRERCPRSRRIAPIEPAVVAFYRQTV